MKDKNCRILNSNSRCEESAAFSIQTSSKWKIVDEFKSISATLMVIEYATLHP